METGVREVQVSAGHIQNLFGQFDRNVKKLERQFDVSITDRNGKIIISGADRNAEMAKNVLEELNALSERGNNIEDQNVDYAIAMCMEENKSDVLLEIDKDCICHTVSGKPVNRKRLGRSSMWTAYVRICLCSDLDLQEPVKPILPWLWQSQPSRIRR